VIDAAANHSARGHKTPQVVLEKEDQQYGPVAPTTPLDFPSPSRANRRSIDRPTRSQSRDLCPCVNCPHRSAWGVFCTRRGGSRRHLSPHDRAGRIISAHAAQWCASAHRNTSEATATMCRRPTRSGIPAANCRNDRSQPSMVPSLRRGRCRNFPRPL